MYSISLFLHIVGALAIFAGLAVEQAALFNLRRSTTTTQARDALSPMKALRFMGPSALLLLVTGVYMMVARWSNQAWAGLGIVGMVVIAIVGATGSGRRLKPLTQALLGENSSGSLSAAVRDRIDDSALRTSAWVRLAVALGIVFDMSVKPAAGPAVIVLVVASVLGLVVSRVGGVSRQTRPVVS